MKLLAILAAAAAVGAAGVDEGAFRYTRVLQAPAGAGVRFEPDARMYGHTRIGFPDLRIVDGADVQVPWRPLPRPAAVPFQPIPLVARGRREGTVSVVADRGAQRPVIDRIKLEIPDKAFVGEVDVQGSATGAEGSYATLSTTPIYAVRGAVDARSTTAVFPATDHRYLLVQASGVSDITGASVARDPERTPLEPVEAKATAREDGTATVVRLDLGFRNVPVDAVRFRSSTQRYVRPVRVEGSNGGTPFTLLAQSEIARFPEVDLSQVDLEGRHRFLRVTIENGDDQPLESLQVETEAMSRPLLLASGNQPPFRLLYGAAGVSAPQYDFVQLPAAATGFERAVEGTLRAERANPLFEAPADPRTFFERNDFLIQVLLVAAALVVAAGGIVALRRRTES